MTENVAVKHKVEIQYQGIVHLVNDQVRSVIIAIHKSFRICEIILYDSEQPLDFSRIFLDSGRIDRHLDKDRIANIVDSKKDQLIRQGKAFDEGYFKDLAERQVIVEFLLNYLNGPYRKHLEDEIKEKVSNGYKSLSDLRDKPKQQKEDFILNHLPKDLVPLHYPLPVTQVDGHYYHDTSMELNNFLLDLERESYLLKLSTEVAEVAELAISPFIPTEIAPHLVYQHEPAIHDVVKEPEERRVSKRVERPNRLEEKEMLSQIPDILGKWTFDTRSNIQHRIDYLDHCKTLPWILWRQIVRRIVFRHQKQLIIKQLEAIQAREEAKALNSSFDLKDEETPKKSNRSKLALKLSDAARRTLAKQRGADNFKGNLLNRSNRRPDSPSFDDLDDNTWASKREFSGPVIVLKCHPIFPTKQSPIVFTTNGRRPQLSSRPSSQQCSFESGEIGSRIDSPMILPTLSQPSSNSSHGGPGSVKRPSSALPPFSPQRPDSSNNGNSLFRPLSPEAQSPTTCSVSQTKQHLSRQASHSELSRFHTASSLNQVKQLTGDNVALIETAIYLKPNSHKQANSSYVSKSNPRPKSSKPTRPIPTETDGLSRDEIFEMYSTSNGSIYANQPQQLRPLDASRTTAGNSTTAPSNASVAETKASTKKGRKSRHRKAYQPKLALAIAATPGGSADDGDTTPVPFERKYQVDLHYHLDKRPF